jgi:pimeloyl-ACP methyl ester carboxylesterase
MQIISKVASIGRQFLVHCRTFPTKDDRWSTSWGGCGYVRFVLELPVHHFQGRDGVRLAYREIGEGRPLILLHGFCSTASEAWLRTGHAETIAARGHRVVMPDLRAHGDSAKPHDVARYPRDVLVDDGLALIEHLGVDGYDLGGYSLGGRIAFRMLVRGATPGRAIVGAQGIREMDGTGGGAGSFLRRLVPGLGTFEPGSREWAAEQRLKEVGADPVALLHVLDALVNTSHEAVAQVTVPTLVVAGADDERAASVEALVAALPHGTHAVVPGDHGTAAAAPELATVMADFLKP